VCLFVLLFGRLQRGAAGVCRGGDVRGSLLGFGSGVWGRVGAGWVAGGGRGRGGGGGKLGGTATYHQCQAATLSFAFLAIKYRTSRESEKTLHKPLDDKMVVSFVVKGVKVSGGGGGGGGCGYGVVVGCAVL